MTAFTRGDLLARWYRDTDCGDCGVALGQAHGPGCDVARCLHSGFQRLSCGGFDMAAAHDCGNALHDGYWPGERECAAYGWYLYMGDEVFPDLNRLIRTSTWDRTKHRWVPVEGSLAGTVDAAMEWYVGNSTVVMTSELDLWVTIANPRHRIVLPRANAAHAAWALRQAAACEAGSAVLHDSTGSITLDENQMTQVARILDEIYAQSTGAPGETGTGAGGGGCAKDGVRASEDG